MLYFYRIVKYNSVGQPIFILEGNQELFVLPAPTRAKSSHIDIGKPNQYSSLNQPEHDRSTS